MRPYLVHWLDSVLPAAAAEALAPSWFTCVGLAGLVSLFWMLALARRHGLDRGPIAAIVLWCYLAAVTAGIAMPMAIDAVEQLALTGRFQLHWAGMTSFWGYLAGTGATALVCRANRLPLARLGDLAAAPLGISLVLARLGCFIAGCDYGKVTSLPWAMRFPAGSPAWHDQVAAGLVPVERAESLPVHPTQLYEVTLGLVIFAVATLLARRHPATIKAPRNRDGRIFLVCAAIYAIGRFAIETLRGDDSRGIYCGLSSAQIFSLLVLAAIAGHWLVRRSQLAAATTAAALVLLLVEPHHAEAKYAVDSRAADSIVKRRGTSNAWVVDPQSSPASTHAQPPAPPTAPTAGFTIEPHRIDDIPIGYVQTASASTRAQPPTPPTAPTAPSRRIDDASVVVAQNAQSPTRAQPAAGPPAPAAQPAGPTAPPAPYAGPPTAGPLAPTYGPPAPTAGSPAPPAAAPPEAPAAQAPTAPAGPEGPSESSLSIGALVGFATPLNRRSNQVPMLGGPSISIGLGLRNIAVWLDLDSYGNTDATHGTVMLSGSMMTPVANRLQIGGRAGLGATLVNFDDPAFRDVVGANVRVEALVDFAVTPQWEIWLRPLSFDLLTAAALGGPILTWQARIGVAYHMSVGHRGPPASTATPTRSP